MQARVEHRLRESISSVLFFSMYPCILVLVLILMYSRHIAVIPATTRHEPGSVPTEPFGIGNEDFNAGKKESKYGYPILELYELLRPVNLGEMKAQWGMGGAPMGWGYVGRDLWENRWGESEARSENVKRVF